MKEVNFSLLQDPEHREAYRSTVRTKLSHLNTALDADDSNLRWEGTLCVVRTAGLAALGTSQRKHRDWFDENDQAINELLRAKNAAHSAALSRPGSGHLRQRFAELRAETQRKLREMENSWWMSFARKIQNYADSNDIHEFYETLTTIVGPTKRPFTPVRSLTGDLLRSKEEVLDRWKEHFSELLNETAQYDI